MKNTHFRNNWKSYLFLVLIPSLMGLLFITIPHSFDGYKVKQTQKSNELKIEILSTQILTQRTSLDSIKKLKHDLLHGYEDSIEKLMALNDSLFVYAYDRSIVVCWSPEHMKADSQMVYNNVIKVELFKIESEIRGGIAFKMHEKRQDSIEYFIDSLDTELLPFINNQRQEFWERINKGGYEKRNG